jgi:Protein of unknown function (DUF3572)
VNRDAAKTLAGEALSFLARDLERLGRFLALTGVDPKQIRALAHDPAFLAAVLEHVLSGPSLLQSFVSETECSAADVAAAHTTLGGRPWERDVP